MMEHTNKILFGTVVFFVLFFGLFIVGWWYQYSGESAKEKTGTIVDTQSTSRMSNRLASVKLENGEIVSADCRNKYRGEKVLVAELKGRISDEIVHKCVEQ